MKPFVLVEIEDGTESDTTVVGDSEVVGLVVDWDAAGTDSDYAADMIEEIKGRYYSSEKPDANVQAVIDRLQDIVDEEEDDYDDEEEDDYEEEEEEDEGDVILDPEAELEQEDRERS